MNTIDRLRQHHRTFRAKLDALEVALRLGPETWFVLREFGYSLSQQLSAHMREEDALIAAAEPRLGRALHERLVLAHRDEPELLHSANKLFLEKAIDAWDQLKLLLMAFIDQLRCHMDDEERELFPTLERFLQQEEATATNAVSAAHPTPLIETMTINRILREHPETACVCRAMFIDIPFEGCDCLDEVAWCHGMESGELIAHLERAIQSGATTSIEPVNNPARSCSNAPSHGGADAELCAIGA